MLGQKKGVLGGMGITCKNVGHKKVATVNPPPILGWSGGRLRVFVSFHMNREPLTNFQFSVLRVDS